MARTKGVPAKPKEETYKEIEHKGFSIRRYESGKIFVVKGEKKIECHSKAEAIELIEKELRKKNEPSGPHAGWMKNPPEDCKHVTADEKKHLWVDVYFCGFKCEKRLTCACAELLQAGRKERTKYEGD